MSYEALLKLHPKATEADKQLFFLAWGQVAPLPPPLKSSIATPWVIDRRSPPLTETFSPCRQTWCSVQRKKTALLALEDDEHAPDSARVNGTGPRPRPGAAMPCSLMDAVLSKGCYSL